MKKLFVILFVSICSCSLYAQDSIRFVLQPTGAFLSEDNQEYIVVEFPEKSEKELFAMVKANVIALYNDPDKVMSTSGGNMINVFGYKENICMVSSLGAKALYGGHYKLVFRFKDGKIRVDAPTIDNKLPMTDAFMPQTIGIPSQVIFSEFAKKVCKGKGKINKEKKEKVEKVVNAPINYLLGLSKASKKDNNDDW